MPDWGWTFLAAAFTGLFFIPAMLLWYFRWRQRRGLRFFLRSEPLTTAPPLPAGPIQAEGVCHTSTPLRAPLSGKECVGFVLDVSVFEDDGEGGTYWELAFVDVLAPFTLALGGVAVPVAVDGSFLCLNGSVSSSRDGPLAELPADLHGRVVAQSQERYHDTRPDILPLPGQEVRMLERLLLPGSTVTVVGEMVAGDESAGEHIGPRQTTQVLVMDGTKSRILSLLGQDLRSPHLLDMLEAWIPDR